MSPSVPVGRIASVAKTTRIVGIRSEERNLFRNSTISPSFSFSLPLVANSTMQCALSASVLLWQQCCASWFLVGSLGSVVRVCPRFRCCPAAALTLPVFPKQQARHRRAKAPARRFPSGARRGCLETHPLPRRPPRLRHEPRARLASHPRKEKAALPMRGDAPRETSAAFTPVSFRRRL